MRTCEIRVISDLLPMIADRIKKARKAKNLSQRELAELMGVTQPIIVRLEKNRKMPSPDELQKLAAILEKELDYFTSQDLADDQVAFDNVEFETNLREARTFSLRHKRTVAAVLKTVRELEELEKNVRSVAQRLPR